MPKHAKSTVLTLRVTSELDRRIERVARRTRRSKSAVAREALQDAFGAGSSAIDPSAEARRQSLLVGGRASEDEALEFIQETSDDSGWR